MNEEQKEAFKVLKGLEFYEYEWYVKTDKIEGHANEVVGKVEKSIKIIVNLIEKQQKEIEKLKDKNKTLEMLLQGNLYEMYKYYRELANSYQANCISKDKIREIKAKWDKGISWANADDHYYAMKMLDELLSGKEGGQEYE